MLLEVEPLSPSDAIFHLRIRKFPCTCTKLYLHQDREPALSIICVCSNINCCPLHLRNYGFKIWMAPCYSWIGLRVMQHGTKQYLCYDFLTWECQIAKIAFSMRLAVLHDHVSSFVEPGCTTVNLPKQKPPPVGFTSNRQINRALRIFLKLLSIMWFASHSVINPCDFYNLYNGILVWLIFLHTMSRSPQTSEFENLELQVKNL